MLQRYSVCMRIYSWFMKYCHPNRRLRASSLFPSGDIGRRQQPAAKITRVDIEDDGDEAPDIVDSNGLYMQIEEGTASCISMAA